MTIFIPGGCRSSFLAPSADAAPSAPPPSAAAGGGGWGCQSGTEYLRLSG